MSVEADFLDTNVILNLMSGDAAKADRAQALLDAGGTISVQVLNEFASVARRKLGCTWPEIGEILATVRALCPVRPLTVEVHDRARARAARYGVPFYDALIAASALDAGCTTLWSEDFQDGQLLEDSVRIRNPFVSVLTTD